MAGIRDICSSLISRATPIRPTAAIVSEEGKLRSRNFPSVQTIRNSYRDMTSIWRDAYRMLMAADLPSPVSVEDMDSIIRETADVGAAALLTEISRHMKELNQRNNVLKQLLHDHVPIDADRETTPSALSFEKIANWLSNARQSGLIDVDGDIRVTRLTPINTLIMDSVVVAELSTLIDALHSKDAIQHALSAEPPTVGPITSTTAGL
jgi:hypothetical protein